LGDDVANGVNGPVYALATDENDVYVGGSFTVAGGVGARNIARWNAITRSWYPLGAGPANGVAQGSVYAILAAGEDVFVGDDFTIIDSIGGGSLARYRRTTDDWSRPFSVQLGSYSGVVRALARGGDSLYIGGWFDQACGSNGCIPAAGVAACSISTGVCAALGSGIAGNDVVKALAVGPTGLLFVGGSFTAAGGINANGIARWDPQTRLWLALGPGIGGVNQVAAIAVDPGQYVYEGGLVLAPDNSRAAQPLVWNGLASGWSALGSGIDGAGSPQVAALALPVPAGLYVAGDFTTAGGKASYYFARWRQPGAAGTIPVGGGTLTSPSDATSYTFAPGAFPAPAFVRHLVLDPADAPSTGGLGGIGHFFTLTAINSATGQPISPTLPYTVTVQYTAVQRASIIESTLGLYFWDGAHWLREASSQVDVATKTVTARPAHFSTWAVLGETRRLWLPLVLNWRPG